MAGKQDNSHQPPRHKTAADQIAQDVSAKYLRAIKAGLPFFAIVYYDHEADKLSLIRAVREQLRAQDLGTRTFDPAHHAEHGLGKLYTLMASASTENSLSLISGLPLDAQTIHADNDFIHYLNIHRDRIPKERIRMILFLHSSYAEQFIFAAGDLWDFRHGTYWLEREPAESRPGLWAGLERDTARLDLTEEEKQAIEKHLNTVCPLIEETEEPGAKAQLLLDLTRWLHRRYAWEPATRAAYEGIRNIENERTQLRAYLEHELGYSLDNQSDLSEALRHYETSLEISREIDDKAGEGATLNNISQIYSSRGDYDTALQYLKQLLAIIQDKAGEGTILNNFGEIYRKRGDYDTALKYLKQSLAIQQEIGNKAGEGAALNNIGLIYHARGDYAAAFKYYKQSLVIIQKIGDKAGESTILDNIASIYHVRGDYDTALKYFKQSLAISQEISYKAGEAVTCHHLANEWERRGNIAKAIEYMTQTMAIDEITGHPDLEQDKRYLKRLRQQT